MPSITKKEAVELYGNNTRALSIALGLDKTRVAHLKPDDLLPAIHAVTLMLLHPSHFAERLEEYQRELVGRHHAAQLWLYRHGHEPEPEQEDLL